MDVWVDSSVFLNNAVMRTLILYVVAEFCQRGRRLNSSGRFLGKRFCPFRIMINIAHLYLEES